MSRFLVVLFVLLPLCPVRVCGQTAENISVEFTRTITRNSSHETVKGYMYYQAPDKVMIKVVDPVKQWLVYQGMSMLIYYPDENRAFKFTSENPFEVPFFQAFASVVREDFGLSEAGFTLFQNEMRGDTLVTYWKPPQQTKEVLGNTITGLAKDKLVFVEVQDTKGKALITTTYRNHFKFGETFFPLEVESVRHQESDSVVEKMVYSHPQFDVALPQEVIDFKIPPDAEVREIKW